MITPPVNVKSFYTALFNKAAASEVARTFSPAYAQDITQVLVTSQDMSSDLYAVAECQTAVNKITSLIGKPEAVLKFNPMYLPNIDLESDLEYDLEGDVVKIGGFSNPYINTSMTCKHEDTPLIEANVCYKPFEVPAVNELLRKARSTAESTFFS